jgi:hypothetical protein
MFNIYLGLGTTQCATAFLFTIGRACLLCALLAMLLLFRLMIIGKRACS